MQLKYILLTVGALVVLLSCGDGGVGETGTLVGGRCVRDTDCRERCLTDGDFPGGYCSVGCQRDSDCPSGTLCVAKSGGVCLLRCELPADCQGLGPGYTCDAKDRQGITNAKALVCIGD